MAAIPAAHGCPCATQPRAPLLDRRDNDDGTAMRPPTHTHCQASASNASAPSNSHSAADVCLRCFITCRQSAINTVKMKWRTRRCFSQLRQSGIVRHDLLQQGNHAVDATQVVGAVWGFMASLRGMGSSLRYAHSSRGPDLALLTIPSLRHGNRWLQCGIRPCHRIHLPTDLLEQTLAILALHVQIEVCAIGQEIKSGLHMQAVQHRLRYVRGAV